jgi:replicative DNA helicase
MIDKLELSRLQETIDSKSFKRELSHLNLTNRIEEMKKRHHQSKRIVASADVDQANIVKEKRVRLVSSKYFKSDYA